MAGEWQSKTTLKDPAIPKPWDTFHRKQIRRLLGIEYPTKITNVNLYKNAVSVLSQKKS